MIAIWSTSTDTTADLVETRLRQQGADAVRLDTDRYGDSYELGWHRGQATISHASALDIPVTQIRSIYYRRPSVREVPRDCREFSLQEAWYFARAALFSATAANWMNHPSAVLASENKLMQLTIASSLGFTIPRSILTSCPKTAYRFFSQLKGRCVCKPGFAGYLDGPEGPRVVYAHTLPESLGPGDFAAVSACPTFLQEEVPKRADIRLTAVGSQCFAARILQDSPQSLDWRTQLGSETLTYESAPVPAAVAQKVSQLLNTLDLNYGALDFAETADGEWIFLEINPAGQWEWLEYEANLPIAGAIADWLVHTPQPA